jgi:immune inhibitor A
MRRHISIFAVAIALAACAMPFNPAPTPAALAPTARPTDVLAAPPATIPANQAAGATNVPAVTADLDDPERIAAAAPAPRDQVALAEAFKGIGDVPDVARTTPLDVKVGDVETFWVGDFATNTNYQVTAKLRYAGSVVLMYVDTTIEAEIDQAAIEQSARQFEQEIYPRDRALFGHEASPGVDGDPRLTVLNAPVRGVGGYFYSSAGVVKAANQYSNEREMFVISVGGGSFGSPWYAMTLAHEFQHMIEWNIARRSPLWFNEGMSTLAQDLNGFVEQGLPGAYLSDPDLQLTTFSQGSLDAEKFDRHYGASQLFLRYFQEQYAGEGGLAELIKADAGNNLAAFVPIAARKRPDIKSFADIYADWAVANVLNDPAVADGRYAYKLLPEHAAMHELQADESTTVSQFGVDYYGELQGPLTINFDGADNVSLTGVQPHDGRYAWWSNRGDDSVETLTRAFDLSAVRQATLRFSAWYELEQNFDYAFVSVSEDGGKTWKALKATTSTDQDPQGHNYGNGITGVSGAPNVETDNGVRGKWVDEQVDLSPFAGKNILLRFWVVNDDGYNAPGLLIDDIGIPELQYSDSAENGDGGWQAQGFVRTTGELPQSWALRLIRMGNGATTVEQPPVDAQGRATVRLGAGERAVLAVIATAPSTTEPAIYRYSVARP